MPTADAYLITAPEDQRLMNREQLSDFLEDACGDVLGDCRIAVMTAEAEPNELVLVIPKADYVQEYKVRFNPNALN